MRRGSGRGGEDERGRRKKIKEKESEILQIRVDDTDTEKGEDMGRENDYPQSSVVFNINHLMPLSFSYMIELQYKIDQNK